MKKINFPDQWKYAYINAAYWLNEFMTTIDSVAINKCNRKNKT